MWFKQITCDKCFKLLDRKKIENCYIVVRYQDRRVINTDLSYNEYLPYADQYIFNYASFNKSKPSGKLFIYKPNEEDMQFSKRTIFCSNECAYKFVNESEAILLYFDQHLNSVRTVCKDMIEVNNVLGGEPLRGLYTAWSTPWVITYPEESLSSYNLQGTEIPTFKAGNLELKQMQPSDSDSLYKIMTEKGFITAFDGHYNEQEFIKTYTQSISRDQINTYLLAAKRRTGAMWKLNIEDKTIGFIRIAFKEKWSIEFGIKSEFRRKGYTSKSLKAILKWCKNNGLSQIHAIVESNNEPSKLLLKQFDVKSIPMVDKNQNGTLRNTVGFTIRL